MSYKESFQMAMDRAHSKKNREQMGHKNNDMVSNRYQGTQKISERMGSCHKETSRENMVKKNQG